MIRTKSVEFMPFWLSFFLTVSAVVWFFYGLLMKDFFVAVSTHASALILVACHLLYVVFLFPLFLSSRASFSHFLRSRLAN